VPIRKKGDGTVPVPGWTGEYDWTGYIPFDQLPYTFNPAEGYIVSANEKIPPSDYPNFIAYDWDYGFRAQRILDLLKNAPGKVDIAYIQKMQGDDYDASAATLVPILLNVNLNDSHLTDLQALLKDWDFQAQADSAPAAIYESFWKHLLADTFNDELPKKYQPAGGNRWFEIMRTVVKDPNSAWWDDKTTKDKIETRDDIFARAFKESVAELESTLGKDSTTWKWGDLHTATFRNASLGESGISLIENLFNRGPFPTSGGSSIVNATAWNTVEGYEVNDLPSMRMIADMSNLNNSLTVHTTGQSGHAYNKHYIDMADLWRNIQYYPMWWNQDSAIKDAEGHLVLTPK